ncbi:MAG: DUF11 domain-containing protein [Gemmatimonadota bacterium]
MRRLLSWTTCLTVLSACTEPLTAPDLTEEAPSEALPLVATASPRVSFTCTRSWAAGVDGDWSDAGSWTPTGIPTDTDNVCIEASGTYDVAIDAAVTVNNLKIGGTGAWATVETEHDLLIKRNLLIEVNGRLEMDVSGGEYLGGSPHGNPSTFLPTYFENYGVLDVNDTSGSGSGATLRFNLYYNYGFMYLPGGTSVLVEVGTYFPWFTNNGFMLTEGTGEVEVTHPDHYYLWFAHLAGTIGGSAPLRVHSDIGMFWWNGGTLPSLVGGSGRSVVRSELPDLALNASTGGNLEASRVKQIQGGIESGGRLVLSEPGDTIDFWSYDGQSPWVNHGDVEIQAEAGQQVELDMGSWYGVENSGLLALVGGAEFSMELVSFLNTGTLSTEEPLRIYKQWGYPEFQNAGLVSVAAGAELTLEDGTFTSERAGEMQGKLRMVGGTLEGAGSLGAVFTEGATVKPGFQRATLPGLPDPRLGTLSMGALFLDASSELVIQVADTTPGSFDRVSVTGAVGYGGKLTVRTLSPFQGGVCGQVIPVITDGGKGLVPRGTFDSFSGLSTGPNRAWRLHNPLGLLALAGYRPGPDPLYTTPAAFALSEGGAPQVYRVCLGDAPPSGDLLLEATSAFGQTTGARPVDILLTEWMLPRTLAVQAIDDAWVEGPHVDTLRHVLVGAGKGGSPSPPVLVPITIADNDGAADLALTKVSQEDNRFVGDTMHTVFRVTNHGPTESSGSTVASTALSGLDFLSASGATCALDGAGAVTCEVGAIPAGGQVDITISFEGATVGVHTSTWTVIGEQPDADATNDEAPYSQRVN